MIAVGFFCNQLNTLPPETLLNWPKPNSGGWTHVIEKKPSGQSADLAFLSIVKMVC